MESSDVSKFRQCVLDGAWDSADEILMRLGFVDEEALWVSRVLFLTPDDLSADAVTFRMRSSSSVSKDIWNS